VIAFATTYNGGLPTTTTQVIVLAFAVAKALWNAGRQALDGHERRHEQFGHGDEGSWELVLKIYRKERQVADLLLAGCDNKEISKKLHIALRRVKTILAKLFMRFGITDGVKRVKLAALLYRERVYSGAGSNV
jgi:DNA-binding NarL/FixJ family response regulator